LVKKAQWAILGIPNSIWNVFGMCRCLGNLLGRGSAKDWWILKIDSEFLSIKFLGYQKRFGFLRFVVLAQGVVFEDPSWKNIAVGSIG